MGKGRNKSNYKSNKNNNYKVTNNKVSKANNKREEKIIDIEEEIENEIEYDEDLETEEEFDAIENESDNNKSEIEDIDDEDIDDEDEDDDDEDEDDDDEEDDDEDDEDDDDEEDDDEDNDDEEDDDEDEEDEDDDDEDDEDIDEDKDDEEEDKDEDDEDIDEDEDDEEEDKDEDEDEDIDDDEDDDDEEDDDDIDAEDDADDDEDDDDIDNEDNENNDEDDNEDDEELEKEIIIKKVEKNNKKINDEKIKNIEKITKEKKKKNNKDSKLTNFLLLIDKHRYPIYAFIAGVLITVFIAMLIWPDRIATLKDGTQPIVKINKKTYTADNLYQKMKDYYSVSLLLDQIDNDLLTKMYPEDDAMKKKIQENAEYYLNMYKQYYNYTQEQFLEKNGFSSYEAFLDYLRLDYRRNKYLDEYIEKNLSDNEIKKYYEENVFGDINTQHILVEVKSNDDDKDSKKLSDEDAKKLAEEIISKINDGTSWDKIKKEYKDRVTFEDLGYQSWDASLEESFMKALKDMEDNSFSKTPVKTSYGYHVINRLDQKKKPSLKKTKDKIIEKISATKKKDDTNLLYKSLISLRKEKGLNFKDTKMKEKYDTYCKQYQ